MSAEPCQRGDGGPPHNQDAPAGHSRRQIRPREQDLEEINRDARVRGGYLGHTAGFQFPGDMEPGCVHGGYSRFPLPVASRFREKIFRLETELNNIEESIFQNTICRRPEARGFIPHGALLDICIEAAKRLLRLETFGDIDRRKKSLLNTVKSFLIAEFHGLRVWTLDDVRRELSPASIWESFRSSGSYNCTARSNDSPSSTSSSGSLTGTGSASDGSSGCCYHMCMGEEPSVKSYNAFTGMIYIDRRSASILSDVASVMMEAGYEHDLREAFDQHCAQLLRYIEALDTDNIFGYHMEEPREILIRVWTSAMHINIGFLSEMQRHLNGQDFGSFNELKDYFLAIAKASVMKLFNSASSICHQADTQIDPSCKKSYAAVKQDLSKVMNVVMVYRALNHGMPTILSLFTGETKEFITVQCQGLTNRLSDMYAKMSIELNNLVRSQHLLITNTGVHGFTKHIMHHIRLLIQEKRTIHLILKGDLEAFGAVLTGLISSLEFTLNVNSRSMQLQGQPPIFLLNNVHFMLKEANMNTDLGLILGERWFAQNHDQVDQCIVDYVEASWTSVMSSLERQTLFQAMLWHHHPQQMLHKFASSFEMAYNEQRNWKVTDPFIRERLRESICQKVIPLYRMHMENYMEKTHKSAGYSIEKLESQLLELFEG